MAKFERVKRFEGDESIQLPQRATKNSAGYDFCVAEDTIIPSLPQKYYNGGKFVPRLAVVGLDDAADYIKSMGIKPVLVPTGIKCKLESNTYLELSVRSSTPLKYLLVLANGVGIIDADYYGNPSNDGEIFFQMINLGPNPVRLKKGDKIGQGIIKPYLITEDDIADGERQGGFGSTTN